MIDGFNLIRVEAGHEVELDGRKLIVTDNEMVVRGNDIFLTQKAIDAIIASPMVKLDSND